MSDKIKTALMLAAEALRHSRSIARHYPEPVARHNAASAAVNEALGLRDEMLAALRKIAAGREVQNADGTTEVRDRDDAMEIAAAIIAKVAA